MKNQKYKVEITDMNALGMGVAHIDHKAVFIRGAVTGDLMEIKIIKEAKSYDVGRIEQLLVSSPYRVKADCPSFPACGGCSFCHTDYAYEKALKKRFVEGFLKKEGLSYIQVGEVLSTGESSFYRNKVQYPYKDGKIGYYAEHSHRIVEQSGCNLHQKEMEKVLQTLTSFLKKEEISSYNEETGEGLLRHIFLRSNFDGSEMQLVLVLTSKDFPKEKELLQLLKAKHPEVKNIFLNIHQEKNNVILGRTFLPLTEKTTIEDRLLDCVFEISPSSFYQVNREAAQLLYTVAIEKAELQKGETLLDLFCGIGTIGICAAKKCEIGKLIGIEVISEAVENAKRNAKRNHIENAEFYCGDANHPAVERADKVIVDPPRKGLDEALIQRLAHLSPKKIVYVSCNPATLARDLARFEKYGYRTFEITPVDLFPRTGHVECVCAIQQV